MECYKLSVLKHIFFPIMESIQEFEWEFSQLDTLQLFHILSQKISTVMCRFRSNMYVMCHFHLGCFHFALPQRYWRWKRIRWRLRRAKDVLKWWFGTLELPLWYLNIWTWETVLIFYGHIQQFNESLDKICVNGWRVEAFRLVSMEFSFNWCVHFIQKWFAFNSHRNLLSLPRCWFFRIALWTTTSGVCPCVATSKCIHPFHAIFYNLVQGCQLILLLNFHRIIFLCQCYHITKKRSCKISRPGGSVNSYPFIFGCLWVFSWFHLQGSAHLPIFFLCVSRPWCPSRPGAFWHLGCGTWRMDRQR